MIDLSRLHQLLDAQIECCGQSARRDQAFQDALSQRDGEQLRSFHQQYQQDAARLQELNRQLAQILQGSSLTDFAHTLPPDQAAELREKGRELARLTADWRIANARRFRFLQRTASASQGMLEQVYGMAGGYDSRGTMMNRYRSS
ncbi:MAG TPA: flagellar export chaperone FlgN [Acidobacteriota bacterium]|nr:flagellar export chaperone FlgN [Acidobacteriota bacterium]